MAWDLFGTSIIFRATYFKVVCFKVNVPQDVSAPLPMQITTDKKPKQNFWYPNLRH